MLSDKEIIAAVGFCTDQMVAYRKVISAYEAKLREQKPVGYVDYGDRVAWYKKPTPETDLFTHPAPIPEVEVL